MESIDRLSTGNQELDHILGGGFPLHSINILMGEPGSGKTVLVEEMIFANASESQRPILYLTTLSEPLEKVIRYLQQFAFFDETKLGDTIIYDSVGDALAEGGVGALVPKLMDAIKTLAPRIIVIDSFKAIHDLSTSIPEMRRLLYETAGLLTAYETTAFLIGEYSESHIPQFPEFAVADGIVELLRTKSTTRDERFLRVLKLRGSSYVAGLHSFQITSEGLEVYPRLVSPEVAPSYESLVQRCTTGVAGLDQMLGGGIWRGSTTILGGPTGSGKTTLAIQFVMDGVRRGEPSLYINFQENPTQLARHMHNLGISAEEIEKLHFIYQSPVEMQVDSIIVEIFRLIEEHGLKRIVIDALDDLAIATDDAQRFHNFLYAMTQHFAVYGVATIMTLELATKIISSRVSPDRLSALCDAFIHLDIDRTGRARRTLNILKARSISHNLDPHELTISSDGMTVKVS